MLIRNHGVCNLSDGSGARGDVRHNVRIIAEPAVPRDFKEISSFPWIWNQDSPEKIPSVGCNIFRKGKRRGHNVLVQEVDVVAFRVGWVVIKWKIACQHRILYL